MSCHAQAGKNELSLTLTMSLLNVRAHEAQHAMLQERRDLYVWEQNYRREMELLCDPVKQVAKRKCCGLAAGRCACTGVHNTAGDGSEGIGGAGKDEEPAKKAELSGFKSVDYSVFVVRGGFSCCGITARDSDLSRLFQSLSRTSSLAIHNLWPSIQPVRSVKHEISSVERSTNLVR